MTETISYDPWGMPSYSGDLSSRTMWKGLIWEGGPNNSPSDVVGLAYMRGRWYDPQAGRFIQEDPLGVDGSVNLYGFAGDDPVNGSDPTGMRLKPVQVYGTPDGPPAPTDPVDNHVDDGPGWTPPIYGGGPDGPTGGTPGTQHPKPVPKKCPKGGSFGAGVGYGGTADAGVAAAGAVATGGVGAGLFHRGGPALSGYSGGVYASGAAAAYAGRRSRSSPAQPSSTGNAGAFAGIGPSIFFTNAASVHELEGPFNTIQVNIGGVYGSGGFQLAWGGGVWQLTVSLPIPLVSPGLGAAGSWVTTNTKTVAATRNACQ